MADQVDFAGSRDATAGPPGPGPSQPADSRQGTVPNPDSGAAQQAERGYRGSRLEFLGIRVSRGQASAGPLRRPIEGRLIGGVAAAIADRTGFDVSLVRAVIVVLALITSGFCAAAYVVAWLLIPAQGPNTSIGTRALSD